MPKTILPNKDYSAVAKAGLELALGRLSEPVDKDSIFNSDNWRSKGRSLEEGVITSPAPMSSPVEQKK